MDNRWRSGQTEAEAFLLPHPDLAARGRAERGVVRVEREYLLADCGDPALIWARALGPQECCLQ